MPHMKMIIEGNNGLKLTPAADDIFNKAATSGAARNAGVTVSY
jgi:hypothetical protein